MAFLGSRRTGVHCGVLSTMRISDPPVSRDITPKTQQLRTTVNVDDLTGAVGWGGGPLRWPSLDVCPGLEAPPNPESSHWRLMVLATWPPASPGVESEKGALSLEPSLR